MKREWRKRVYRVYTLEVRSSCDQSFMFQWILPTDSSPPTTTRPCSRKLFLVRLKVYHFFSASDPLCIASLICLCIKDYPNNVFRTCMSVVIRISRVTRSILNNFQRICSTKNLRQKFQIIYKSCSKKSIV